MARFKSNRQWTLILALCVSLTWCLAAHRPALAGGNDWGGDPTVDPVDPGQPPGTGGDPDVPTGPGKSARIGKQQQGGVINLGAYSAGDGRASSGVWIMRLRIVLQSMGSVYFRF